MDNVFAPGIAPNTVINSKAQTMQVPAGWILLPPGDAALTRRVKAAGDHWIIQEKKGRKIFSRGVWADAQMIERIREELETERSTEQYARRKASDVKRREHAQVEYVDDFFKAVMNFLKFHPQYEQLAREFAQAVTEHATPVGSGTVARTKRIPVEQRAEAAVIAWMRHQTTGYDDMKIARIKGERREVRRRLAERSRQLLEAYRKGLPIQNDCPLQKALNRS